jgi:hypothetical protein
MDAKNKKTRAGRACGADNSLASLPVTNGPQKPSPYTIKIKAKDKKHKPGCTTIGPMDQRRRPG